MHPKKVAIVASLHVYIWKRLLNQAEHLNTGEFVFFVRSGDAAEICFAQKGRQPNSGPVYIKNIVTFSGIF